MPSSYPILHRQFTGDTTVMFSKQELDDMWENKPYGYFTKLTKGQKGKTRYKIKTVAYKVVEEVLGEEETIVWAKSSTDAVSSVNHNKSVGALRQRLSLNVWDSKVRYITKFVGRA